MLFPGTYPAPMSDFEFYASLVGCIALAAFWERFAHVIARDGNIFK